ncbi:hypothetical protein GCM10019016_104250 [Streptomyces prasinosporus]|uniref:Uncharacterized protein n=1 Tax=Streptomyces prasinosporus TaxID=68256 RepID=A0ABP6U8R9_9ACTN
MVGRLLPPGNNPTAHPTALSVIGISRFRGPDTDRGTFLAQLRPDAHEVGFFCTVVRKAAATPRRIACGPGTPGPHAITLGSCAPLCRRSGSVTAPGPHRP